jgi:hypothetical protein
MLTPFRFMELSVDEADEFDCFPDSRNRSVFELEPARPAASRRCPRPLSGTLSPLLDVSSSYLKFFQPNVARSSAVS